MAKTKVHVKYSFSKEEVLLIRAKDPKAVICDANNFCFINFDEKEIVAAGKDNKTKYLVAKAKGENPEPVKE